MISQMIFLFFFKQKTAYEMRISDWSSDVCSSDLALLSSLASQYGGTPRGEDAADLGGVELALDALVTAQPTLDLAGKQAFYIGRSEERRVEKECVSTCRSR